MSGAALTPQHLQEPLGPPEDCVPAVFLFLTLPDVQLTHESEGLLFEKSPNSGKDCMASSLVTAENVVAGMKEGKIEKLSFLTSYKIAHLP